MLRAPMRVAVVQFPGSNADWDALHTVRDVVGADAWYAFHKNETLGDADAVVIPGGFSYGDYLRAGAIAGIQPHRVVGPRVRRRAAVRFSAYATASRFSPRWVFSPARSPATHTCSFECRDVHLRVENEGPFTDLGKGQSPSPADRTRGRSLPHHRRRARGTRGPRPDRVSLLHSTPAKRPDGKRRQPERLRRATSPESTTATRTSSG